MFLSVNDYPKISVLGASLLGFILLFSAKIGFFEENLKEMEKNNDFLML